MDRVIGKKRPVWAFGLFVEFDREGLDAWALCWKVLPDPAACLISRGEPYLEQPLPLPARSNPWCFLELRFGERVDTGWFRGWEDGAHGFGFGGVGMLMGPEGPVLISRSSVFIVLVLSRLTLLSH